MNTETLDRYRLKRAFDASVAAACLIIALPILVVAITAIKASSPGPVFFRQTRIGFRGKAFSIVKLRTMIHRMDRPIGQTTSADSDVFPIGRLLRRFKLDELPQLWNVLRGDMSLVGPRPCLPETAETMPAWALKRFQVRPGLTGLAQVSGNIELTWEQRWKYDVRYVDTTSFVVDCVIIFRTFAVVIMGEGRFRRTP